MTGGKFHLQSVQLAGFVPHSHHTINVDEDGGRIERADDVERVPLAPDSNSIGRIALTNGLPDTSICSACK